MSSPADNFIFAKIARHEIPVEAVYENEYVIAFPDLHPQAPVHILVIPKAPVENLGLFQRKHYSMAAELLIACAEVARRTGITESGFRVVFNTGADAGQTINYLHAHVLGGQNLGAICAEKSDE